jgi:two-component system LytT family response regulator
MQQSACTACATFYKLKMCFQQFVAKGLFILTIFEEIPYDVKIVVIDDEPKARSLLTNLIRSASDAVHELHQAADLASGVQMIREHNPHLVFLDIEMPNEQGTEILNYFEGETIDFDIVFTTAYSEYALKAFEINAIDYLLKPIRPKRLKEVLERVRTAAEQKDIQLRLEELRNSLRNNHFDKIGLPVQDGIEFVPLQQIIRLEADGMYTKVKRENGEEVLVSKPLKYFQHLLESGTTFYRPHRSHIINMTFLKQYVRRDGHSIVLENGDMVPVAKDKKEEFLELVSSI